MSHGLFRSLSSESSLAQCFPRRQVFFRIFAQCDGEPIEIGDDVVALAAIIHDLTECVDIDRRADVTGNEQSSSMKSLSHGALSGISTRPDSTSGEAAETRDCFEVDDLIGKTGSLVLRNT